MILYSKGQCTSFDMTTVARTRVHPLFLIRPEFKSLADFGHLTESSTLSELREAVSAAGAVGMTVIANDDAGSVIDSTGTVTQGGYIIVLSSMIAIVYISTCGFTVYKDSSEMKPHFSAILPVSVLSTPGSRIVGRTPTSYTFVDGGLIELYDEDMCSRIPNCSFALTKYGRLVAVFGLSQGSATLDFKPTSSRGVRASLLSSKRRHISVTQLPADRGVFVGSADTISAAIEQFQSGGALDESFCYEYVRPASLASLIATRLAYLKYAKPSDLRTAEFAAFLASGSGIDGDSIREFINGDESAAQYVWSSESSFAYIQRENDAYYQRILKETLEALRATGDSVILSANCILQKYIEEASGDVKGILRGRENYPELVPSIEYLDDLESVKDWVDQIVNRLAFLGRYIEVDEKGQISLCSKDLETGLRSDGPYEQLDNIVIKTAERSLAAILPADGEAIDDLRYGDPGVIDGKLLFGSDSSMSFDIPTGVEDVIEGRLIGSQEDATSCHKGHCRRLYTALSPNHQHTAGSTSAPDCHTNHGDCINGGIYNVSRERFVTWMNSLPWVRVENGQPVYHQTGYNGRRLSRIERVDVLKMTPRAGNTATLTLGVRLRVRLFDQFSAWWSDSHYHRLNRDLIAFMLTNNIGDGSKLLSVEQSGFSTFAPTLRSAAFRVPKLCRHDDFNGDNGKNGRGAADCSISGWYAVGCPSVLGVAGVEYGGRYGYRPCDYTYLYIKLQKDINVPALDYTDKTGVFALSMGRAAQNINSDLASRAAEHLVRLLVESGLLQDVKFVYDLTGLGRDLIEIADAQQLTEVKLDTETGYAMIAQMLKYRQSVNRDSGVDILTDIQKSRINQNIRAVCIACGIEFQDSTDIKVADLSESDLITEVKRRCTVSQVGTGDAFWYRADTAGIAPAKVNLGLWPYYGAIV